MSYLHPKRTASNGPSHRILALLALLTLLPMGTVSAMHHLAEEGQSDTQAQIATAERFIDAFYSFDAAKLAPLLEHASDSAPGILYYQGWAEGGNYKVLERAPCKVAEAGQIACAITVQDDPVLALKTGFNVTDTFHLRFEGAHLSAVETSSNDQPIYYEARKWVEANLPEVMTGPCKDRNTEESTPVACAKAMTKGYQAFYEAEVAPKVE